MPDKTREEVIQELVEKTMRELNTPVKPIQDSRVWKDPEGYRYLTSWSNSVLLRYFIRLYTSSLPKSEYRRKAQLDDAGRSNVRNQEEGFKRSTTSEYIEFIGFSQGSLEEIKGDIRELAEDGFLKSVSGSNLAGIGINLKDLNTALKEVKGNLEDGKFTYRPLIILYPPLIKIKGEDLTYEVFMELINKTDYLLRVLVQSLEKKLSEDQKYYQVGQAKIKDKFKKY